MKIERWLFRLATIAGLLATVAAGAPVSRIVFGTNLSTASYSNPLVVADRDGNSYVATTGYTIVDYGHGNPINEFPFPVLQKISADGSIVFTHQLDSGFVAVAVAVSAAGNVYLAVGYQTGGPDAAALLGGSVTEFTPDGSEVWTAGISGMPAAIVVDSAGAVYVVGAAGPNFHSTAGSFQAAINSSACAYVPFAPLCTNAFAAKISPDGSTLVYATFLGGSGTDAATSVAVDASGSAYVAGNAGSPDFPATLAAGGGGGDIFVSKLNAGGSALLYSAVVGGSGLDTAAAVVVDSQGSAYIAGKTASTDFPVSDAAYQHSYAGGASDAFVLKLDGSGQMVFSTYLGSSGDDQATAAVLNSDGRIYIAIESTVTSARVPNAGPFTIALLPEIAAGPFYATMKVRQPGPCDPFNTAVAIDPSSGAAVDVEGLPGFTEGPVSLSSDGLGLVHVAGVTDGATSPFAATTNPFGGGDLLLRVDFTKADVFLPACVANSATGSTAWPGGGVSMANTTASLGPGEIIRIQGAGLGPSPGVSAAAGSPLPNKIMATEVLLDGTSLPLIYASDSEIDAVIPYSQPSGSSVQMTVRNGDLQANYPFITGPRQPGLFTRDGSGRGQVAALNEDGTVNSLDNPAARGSIVSLFATGLGPLSPALADDAMGPMQPPLPALVTPVAFTIWSTSGTTALADMPVVYAGPAPGEAAGVYQINVQIPDSAVTGNSLFQMQRTWGGLGQTVLGISVK